MILRQLGDLMYGTTARGCFNTTDISNRNYESFDFIRLPKFTSKYLLWNNPLVLAKDNRESNLIGLSNLDTIYFGIVLGGGGAHRQL